jgi:hypothetical protein
LAAPRSCSTRLGRSPPFVLGGIQLSGPPWSLVQARRRPCSALLCTGQPFHPVPVDLGIAPSSRLTGRVSFLFRCQPSPATPLGVVHPAVREELPQEIPVAHPPTRVMGGDTPKTVKSFCEPTRRLPKRRPPSSLATTAKEGSCGKSTYWLRRRLARSGSRSSGARGTQAGR